MRRYGSGFMATLPILLLFLRSTVIDTATARPDPESNSTGTARRGSTTPPPTGPNTTTKQPFHVLAADVEYFGFDRDSEEPVKEGTGVDAEVDMDTTTEPGEPFSPAGNS